MIADEKIIEELAKKTRAQWADQPVWLMGQSETVLLYDSIPIIEALFCWVNGKSFSIEDSQQIDHENAEALWKGRTINVLR